MKRTASLIATLTEPPTEADLGALPAAVDWLEVRADLVGEIDPEWLRSRFHGRLLYTLRSCAEGGGYEGSFARRRRLLGVAGDAYDRVDLEIDRDLEDEVLQGIPAEKRLLSWHGPGRDLPGLRRILARARTVDAALYKLVPSPIEAGDELAPLALLAESGDDVLAFAGGESGVWTRLVAPYLGARILYGAVGATAGAPGQPTIQRLIGDYGLPELREVEWLAGIVGNPVSHSLSPRLHNAAYRALGLPGLYLPFAPARFADFWLETVEGKALGEMIGPLVALSVTAPFKNLAVAVAGAVSPLATTIDSANTLVLRQGVWEAESTDPEGVVSALAAAGVSVRGRRAAVVGCGGAGRAAAAGLHGSGADVTLVNRGEERGREAAATLGLRFLPLSGFDPAGFDLVVNATSLGHLADDPLPIEPERLAEGTAVLDLVYGEGPTEWIRLARDRGLVTVDGREVLLAQARSQFRLMTGHELPEGIGRRELGLERSTA